MFCLQAFPSTYTASLLINSSFLISFWEGSSSIMHLLFLLPFSLTFFLNFSFEIWVFASTFEYFFFFIAVYFLICLSKTTKNVKLRNHVFYQVRWANIVKLSDWFEFEDKIYHIFSVHLISIHISCFPHVLHGHLVSAPNLSLFWVSNRLHFVIHLILNLESLNVINHCIVPCIHNCSTKVSWVNVACWLLSWHHRSVLLIPVTILISF